MRYISTRGQAPILDFSDVLLGGLARDGGLYVPEHWPSLDQATIRAFLGKPYWQVAQRVIEPFLGGGIEHDVFRDMLQDAYAGFRHRAVAPLVQVAESVFVQELFHGPTLAFKDVAMQLLSRLMDRALKIRNQRATIIGATSGDTGSAAIEAFRGLAQVDVIILYPQGRITDVQRRQMTTIADTNVHAVAIEGAFDDCQAIVKGLFNNHVFRDELTLSTVNSINWARIIAQVVYYVTAAVSLGAPERPVSFSVPTGNFGDVFAGFAARQMGVPIERLIVATNVNDILVRALQTGLYEARDVIATASPSMDIQVSSNFERLLYYAYGCDARAIRSLMTNFAHSHRFTIEARALKAIEARFDAASVDEVETAGTIREVWRQSGYLLDPHTAVAVAAGAKINRDLAIPLIVLATAHPAKFPLAVERAAGVRPLLPTHLADLFERPERITILPNDRGAVEAFIRSRSRIVS